MTLNRTLIAASVLATLAATSANAAEYTFAIVEPVPPTAELVTALDRICNGAFVLSARALEACQTGNMPRVSGDGDTFISTGLGGEFNVLLRQPVTVAAE